MRSLHSITTNQAANHRAFPRDQPLSRPWTMWLMCNGRLASPRQCPQPNNPAHEVRGTIGAPSTEGLWMNFSNSKDQTLLSLWESVRRQVLADRANGGRSRVGGDNLRTYAESLRSEMDRRELKYTSINSTE